MRTSIFVFAGLFITAGIVLLLGHLHQRSAEGAPSHHESQHAIPKVPVPEGTTARPKRPRPELDADPAVIDVAIPIAQNPTHVPWMPDGTHRDRGWVKDEQGRRLGWQVISNATPRALRVFETLEAHEADELVRYAKKFMERSMVISSKFDGHSEVNQVRTSTGMFMSSAEQRDHPINKKLHQRARAIIGLPDDSWIEATQILRYEPGQFYRSHMDTFDAADAPNMNRGGQRLMTLLTWLADVDDGGETSFPYAKPKPIAAAPAKGQSVLFYDVDHNAVVDPASNHGAVPPGPGCEKWVAVLWCHGRPFA